MKPFLTALLLGPSISLLAQDYVTPDQYDYAVESDLVYGIAPNYLGVDDTLMLDIYRPLSNTDTQRPLLICAHGGSLLGGCKDDPSGIVPLLLQFVKRGYVVASINYRLGWHKDDYVLDPVAGFAPTLWPEAYRSFYALDTLEMVRAIYRGMQDMKGAIRFMKARAEMDSTCTEKVFIAGESAGAFVALATAFLDRDSEKPMSCGPLPDAAPPYYKCANLTGLNCVVHDWDAQGDMLTRGNLGPVEGDLNLNGTDARIRGVAAFYGGVPLDAFALDWWQGTDTPSVYLYHQTCDGVVMSGTGRPQTIMSGQCNLGSTPWHYNYPIMAGSLSLQSAFNAMDAPPSFLMDIEQCPSFDWTLPWLECPRYGNNGAYHYTANHALRGANLSAWWALIANEPACVSTGIEHVRAVQPNAYPQPARDLLHVPGWDNADVRLHASDGRLLRTERLMNGLLAVHELNDGVYLLRRLADGAVLRFVVRR